LVHEFDRLFDGDDVPRIAAVDVIDQRGERGRFARAGRARDQDQATADVGEAFDDGRDLELFERRDLVRDEP
jgi:hypothetical protein